MILQIFLLSASYRYDFWRFVSGYSQLHKSVWILVRWVFVRRTPCFGGVYTSKRSFESFSPSLAANSWCHQRQRFLRQPYNVSVYEIHFGLYYRLYPRHQQRLNPHYLPLPFLFHLSEPFVYGSALPITANSIYHDSKLGTPENPPPESLAILLHHSGPLICGIFSKFTIYHFRWAARLWQIKSNYRGSSFVYNNIL